MKHSASFFCNRDCAYVPCHPTEQEDFNCLFCYCPLYPMADCGGVFTRLEDGTKDCSACLLPHRPEGYDYVVEKLESTKL